MKRVIAVLFLVVSLASYSQEKQKQISEIESKLTATRLSAVYGLNFGLAMLVDNLGAKTSHHSNLYVYGAFLSLPAYFHYAQSERLKILKKSVEENWTDEKINEENYNSQKKALVWHMGGNVALGSVLTALSHDNDEKIQNISLMSVVLVIDGWRLMNLHNQKNKIDSPIEKTSINTNILPTLGGAQALVTFNF